VTAKSGRAARVQTPRSSWERALRRSGCLCVAGVDEAGRGCLAGPVVAAAAILRPGARLPGLRDSKLLSPRARQRLVPAIQAASLAWRVASVSATAIDSTDIRQASFLAMRRAIAGLDLRPDHVIVDGFSIPGLDLPQTGLVKADRRCRTVAAASILAKVARDRLMDRYHRLYPEYGFDRNRGYPTPHHLDALVRLGPAPVHRRTFLPVQQVLSGQMLLPLLP
jgi:ribonuclease HII